MSFKKFQSNLKNLSSHDFQHYVFDIIKVFLPDLKYAKDLNILDRSGIDLIHINNNDICIEAIQCKGFELPGFGQDQFDQCEKSISVFLKSRITVKKYTLIINRGATSKDYSLTYRDLLLKELKKIKDAKKAESVSLLDLDSFVAYVCQNIEKDIKNLILKSNHKFRKEYMERMQQQNYIDDIPFIFETAKNKIKRNNPIHFLDNRLSKRISNKVNLSTNGTSLKNNWLFIMGEFGFGKTSMLLNLAFRLKTRNKIFLYLPIALTSKNFIDNGTSLSKNILQNFLNFDSTKNEVSTLYPHILTDMLKKRTDVTLLIDGLDEGGYLYYENGLRRFFNLFREYNVSIIFSLRTEFYFEKGDEFSKAVKSKWDHKQILFLENWETSHMSKFIDGMITDRINNCENLIEFKRIVESNQYEDLYGDIPKRPLFLQMLCDDIINGGFSKKTKDELYQSYFLRKFDLDRSTSIGDIAQERRPLNYGNGEQKTAFKIMKILEEVAGKLIIYNESNNQINYKENIDEYSLEAIIKNYFPNANEIMEFLLHSILIPQQIRTEKTQILLLRFAHRSFQEFFTRQYLKNNSIIK